MRGHAVMAVRPGHDQRGDKCKEQGSTVAVMMRMVMFEEQRVCKSWGEVGVMGKEGSFGQLSLDDVTVAEKASSSYESSLHFRW